MEKLDGFVDWGQDGWNRFFVQKGKRWRTLDYLFLNSIFDLSELRGSLLDVGCALGDGLVYLRKKSPKIDRFVGTDFSGEAIDVCMSNPKLRKMEFFRHDILKPFPEKYDNIICLQTLEHVQNPRCAMLNLIDATRDLLIVGVPYRNRRSDENHLWSFDENDFSELVDSHCIDKRKANIYWLIDKQKKGFSFHMKRLYILQEFKRKLFYTLPQKLRTLIGGGQE